MINGFDESESVAAFEKRWTWKCWIWKRRYSGDRFSYLTPLRPATRSPSFYLDSIFMNIMNTMDIMNIMDIMHTMHIMTAVIIVTTDDTGNKSSSLQAWRGWEDSQAVQHRETILWTQKEGEILLLT